MGHFLEKLRVTALVGMVPQSTVPNVSISCTEGLRTQKSPGLGSSGGDILITVHTFSGRPF